MYQLSNQTSFSASHEIRNHFCEAKDKILVPLLKKINVSDPNSFHAILMPSLYGIETFHLVERGVPASNLFAIEDNCAEINARGRFDVHGEIQRCSLADRKELKGMRTTGHPKSFSEALDEAYWAFDGKPYDLIYLDFLSQPDYKIHYLHGLIKIMRARMLAPKATLILNFGRSRCPSRTSNLNKDILRTSREFLKRDKGLPTEVYIGAAIAKTGHPKFKKIESHSYLSKPENGTRSAIEYVTTVANF